MEIINNKTYFFLTKSVFESASKNRSNISSKFLLKCVMIKLLHKEKINPHIVFFLSDEAENLKIEFGDKFQALMEIGENMFFPEYNPTISGNINQRILSYATDKDGEIPETDSVKIVCGDTQTKMYLDKEINDHSYPVGTLTIEEALTEMEKITKQLEDGKGYTDSNSNDLIQSTPTIY